METIYNRLIAQVIDTKSNTSNRESLIKPVIFGLCMIALIGVFLYLLSESFTAFLITGAVVLICLAIRLSYRWLSQFAIDIDIEDIVIDMEKDWR